MKKLLLVSLCVLSLYTNCAIAQLDSEGPPGGPSQPGLKCAPFDKIEPKLKEEGFTPVFLGMDESKVKIAILQNKDNQWMLMQIFYINKKIIACDREEGDEGIITKQDFPPKESKES